MTLSEDDLARLKTIKEILATPAEDLAEDHKTKLEDIRRRIKESDYLYYWQQNLIRELTAYYRPEEIQARKTFSSDFPGEMAEKFRAATKYFKSTGYYHYTAQDVPQAFVEGDDKAHTPTRGEFLSLTENKYFAKIWTAKQAEAKFQVGDFICFRAESALPQENPLVKHAPWEHRTDLWRMKQFAGKAGFIVQVEPIEPTSPAKGSKVYKILLRGSPIPMLVEERHIKKGRLPKKK